ncbi:hypothetical protein EDB19DRAFT_1835076 [Suillus lakei]|nr:hypothetical protein EDB19DRAFT_1835076 [Suillus lakei]
MPPRYKSEEDRHNARLQSKRAHYARNKTTEQAKSRSHWRRQSHMSDLGYKARVPEHNSLQNRFLAVLQHIDTEGWDVMSPELKDCVTLLSETVQLCAPGIRHNTLLQQCEELPCLTTQQLAAEREFATLIDRGGTEAYDDIIHTQIGVWTLPLRSNTHPAKSAIHHCRLWSLVKNRRVVRNETNDTPQPTRQEQQHKHTSFEAESSGCLAASSVYYTIPHSPAKCQFEESDLQDVQNDEFDFSSLNSFNKDLCDTSTESHAQKRPAGDNPLSVWTSDADLFLLEFLHFEGCEQTQYFGLKTVMAQI